MIAVYTWWRAMSLVEVTVEGCWCNDEKMYGKTSITMPEHMRDTCLEMNAGIKIHSSLINLFVL